jgi:hypothetical protein
MFRRTAGSMVLTVALTLAASGCSGGSSGGDTDPIPDPDPCTPSSCAFDACGTFSDGCDGTLDCTCAGALVCGGVTPERCAACSADGLCLESVTSTKPGFRAVFGTSPTDVWLVDRGLSGAVFQWDGTGWHDRSSTDVKGGPDQIWGTSPISLWGVSAWGIWRWDGTAWSRPVTTWTNLYAIWGAAEDDVWGVGAGEALVLDSDGSIALWNGTDLVSHGTGQQGDAYAFWAFGKDDVWSAGFYGTVEHYDGTTWTDVERSTTSDLFAVWGAPNGDVWIPVLNREVLRRKAP